MKKLTILLLTAAACLALVACGSSAEGMYISGNPGNTTTENSLPLEGIEEPNAPETDDPAPSYTIIELTAENWDTYFEVVEVPYFSENAFGEAYRLHIQHYFKLKSEYSKISETETSIAIEYSYTMGWRACVVNFESKSFTLGAEFMNAYPIQTLSATEDCFRYLDRIGTFGVEAGFECSCGKGETAVVNQYCADFQIVRAQGQLCLEK